MTLLDSLCPGSRLRRWPGSGASGASPRTGSRRSSSPPTPNWKPRSATSWACTWTHRRMRRWSAWTRNPRSLVLRDGSAVLIRQVQSTDAPLLADGFTRLSDASRQMRFLTRKKELSPAELRYFTNLDHHNHEALGALDHGGRGAGARTCPTPTPRPAAGSPRRPGPRAVTRSAIMTRRRMRRSPAPGQTRRPPHRNQPPHPRQQRPARQPRPLGGGIKGEQATASALTPSAARTPAAGEPGRSRPRSASPSRCRAPTAVGVEGHRWPFQTSPESRRITMCLIHCTLGAARCRAQACPAGRVSADDPAAAT